MKASDTRIAELMRQGKGTGEIAQLTGMSYSNASWRINRIKRQGSVQVAPAVNVAPAVSTDAQTGQTPAEQYAFGQTVIGRILEQAEVPTALQHFVPAPIQNYVSREVDADIEMWLRLNPASGYQIKTVSLIGEAGSGKNYAVRQYASRHGLPLLIVPCDNAKVLRDMLGYWQAVNGSTVWQDGLLAQFLVHPCVVMFDEVNCLPAGKLFMLHEMLENRMLFVNDAPSDKSIIRIHPEARIVTAMNPPTAQYSGTNRLNVALSSRMAFVDVPEFDIEQLGVNTGRNDVDAQLVHFYKDVRKLIADKKYRMCFSKRHVDAISTAVKAGASVKQAIRQGFINSALATASSVERDAVLHLATLIFGADALGVKKQLDDAEGEDI